MPLANCEGREVVIINHILKTSHKQQIQINRASEEYEDFGKDLPREILTSEHRQTVPHEAAEVIWVGEIMDLAWVHWSRELSQRIQD